MPRRTQLFQMIPWSGGVNTSVDSGVLPADELVQADNVVFATSSSRLKREGFDFFDTEIPATLSRSSSGTTRTMVFASSINIASPLDQIIVVGEKLTVVGAGNSNYNTTAAIVASLTTTNVTNDTITYTFAGAGSLNESIVTETAATVSRNYDVLAVHDFWSFDATNSVKDQLLMAVTSQGLLFKYDQNGRRKQIAKGTTSTALPATATRSSSGTTRTLKFASSLTNIVNVGDYITISGAGNANYDIQSVPILTRTTTTNTNDTITYAAVTSLTEAVIADTAAVVTWDDARTVTSLPITTLASADLRTFNNVLIWTMSGLGNTPKFYDPAFGDTWADLRGAPDASIMQEHQSRLWANDKIRPDYLHYCSPFNQREWLGIGDSGALLLSQGDGDPSGITAILPPFKGVLIVQKGTKTRQVVGSAPEDYQVLPMSEGIGAVSHKAAVAVDLDDVYFMSQRGFHSVIATNTTGDFAANYMSKKIQPTFNTWNRGQARYTQGTYISNLNSVAWTVAENGQTKANSIWLYNPTTANRDGTQGAWYRWPNLFAQSISTMLVSNSVRVVAGDNEGRIIIGQNGEYTDFGTDGISYRVKSGTIYADGNPQTIKAYKKFGLVFRPKGRVNFTAYFKVDNQPVQALSFSQTIEGDSLGTTFVLGNSTLGSTASLAPYMKDVEGHGRGCSVEIFQTGADAQVEIYGYIIEYESADIADEVEE